jgi:hypothetical protein
MARRWMVGRVLEPRGHDRWAWVRVKESRVGGERAGLLNLESPVVMVLRQWQAHPWAMATSSSSRCLVAKARRAAWVWVQAPRITDVACIRASVANRLGLDG